MSRAAGAVLHSFYQVTVSRFEVACQASLLFLSANETRDLSFEAMRPIACVSKFVSFLNVRVHPDGHS